MSTAAEVWTSQESFASTLLVLFLDTYGHDAEGNWVAGSGQEETDPLTWDPETIAITLERDYNIELPAIVLDRLMVAIRIRTTDEFFQSLQEFITGCNVLSGTPASAEFDPADAAETAWGITEALLLVPPAELPDDDEPFSQDILGYIGYLTAGEGLQSPPDVLRIGTPPPQAADDYSDDPQLLTTITELQTARGTAIQQMLENNLAELRRQIDSLPLRYGKPTWHKPTRET